MNALENFSAGVQQLHPLNILLNIRKKTPFTLHLLIRAFIACSALIRFNVGHFLW